MSGELWTCQLGAIDYREAHDLQRRIRDARAQDLVPDVLLLLEHPPVYTTTRLTTAQDLPMGEDWYRANGIDVVQTDRGGKLTYHGPGQLVGYPIMRCAGVRRFMEQMEEAIVAGLADEGLPARGRSAEGAELAGVWLDDHRKIASVGVRVRDGVTTHGFAVNVQNDLQPFHWAVACGLPEVETTSVAKAMGRTGDLLPCFRKRVAHRFAQTHGLRQRLVSLARLEQAIDAPVSSVAP